jgi:serine/threonine-protein kinase
MANPEDLGRYRLKRLLGRGALGEVWEATDLEQEGNKVAVKIMHAADDELALARSTFAREARLASLLRHPHVVAVHDAGEAAGTSFMVMDMVEGRSLRAMMGDPSTTLAEKLRWIRQVGDGLSAMHRAGLVHRDLKPENVIVRPDRTACIVDLGMAKWTKFDLGGERDPQDELVAELVPPPSVYVPPETIAMELYDELGDQYAFGVLAYELITGSAPKDDAPPLAERDDIPKAIAAALDRARSPERGDRWDAMERLLDEIVDRTAPKAPAPADAPPARPTPSTSPQPSASVASRPRVSPLLVGAVALVLVLAAAALVALR